MSQQGQSRFLLQLQANNVRRVLAPAIVARVAATHDHTITEVLQQGIMQLLALVFVSIDHRTTKPQLQAPAAIVFVVENQPICSLLSETSISQSLTECTNIGIGAVLLRFNLRNDQRLRWRRIADNCVLALRRAGLRPQQIQCRDGLESELQLRPATRALDLIHLLLLVIS